MNCPNCGQELGKNWQRCQKCGLLLNCPKCDRYIPDSGVLSNGLIVRCQVCQEPLVSSHLKKRRNRPIK